MPENRSRFVVLSQQVLAFGTVLAVVVPAAGVVTLDIVAPGGAPTAGGVAGGGAARGAAGSLVASEPVTPEVKEIRVGGVSPRGLRSLSDNASTQRREGARLAALSAPQPVSGYATVGVTWKHGTDLSSEEVTVSVRSLKNGAWSDWQPMPYDDDHQPDPGSEEARQARPGTDPIVVGDVDDVQVKAVTASGQAPPDMQLAVVDPELTTAPRVEQPAIDTAKLASADPADPATSADAVLSSSADATPRPQIYSRAQWGADESMRDKSSLRYYEVHAGFVHHTVNANSYTRAQVPSIIRGIYAYHTQSKGWSDIGYNFLVDRFGRIWEGRYGGVDRPVVGAHTLGYNDYSFAMSAIGNYETGKPSAAMVDAYARLFAWKLSLHGVYAASTRQWVGKKYFQAISGHRDAGQTACPGKYLYAKLPTIRALAAKYQKPFTARAKSANISGTHWPDLVVRDKVSKRAYLVRTAGQVRFEPARTVKTGWAGMDLITAARDLTGDGRNDIVARNAATKVSTIYPGNGAGGFGAGIRSTGRFSNMDQLVGVGDLNGDGRNDLVGRNKDTKRLYLYRGTGKGGFMRRARTVSTDWSAYNLTIGAADFNGDGRNDLLARSGDRLWLFPGTNSARLRPPVALPGKWGAFDLIAGLGDATNDGKPDIVARARKSKLTYIYPGDGRGGYGARYGAYTTFRSAGFLANAGQVSGGRNADLVGRDSSGRLVVYTNTGGQNIGSVVSTGTTFPSANLVLNAGDWDGDGHGDVITRSRPSGNLYLYRGNGRSQFAAPVRMATGWRSVNLLAAVGDITGDGFPDLMGQPSGGAMRIYPGNGATGFRASYVAHAGIGSDAQMGVGLWDADGSPDSMVRRSDGSLVLYRGNGPGGLFGGTKVGTGAGRYDWIHGVGDADGDGRPDLIARERTTGTLWLLPAEGSGFAQRRYIGAGFERFDLSG